MGSGFRAARVTGAVALVVAIVSALIATSLAGPGRADAAAVTIAARGPGMVPHQNVAAMLAAVQPPAQTNTVYVAVSPCRIVDTRAGGGAMAAGSTRSFVVSSTTGFPAQGGKSGGCGLPASATSVSISMVAVGPGHSGYLSAWPAGTAKPSASVLNYPAVADTSTGLTITIKPNVAAGAAQLSVFTSGGPTHLVIDVAGYYVPQMHGMVAPAPSGSTTASIYAGSVRIVSATNPSPGVYQVKFDSSILYCTPMINTYNAGPAIYGAAYAFSNDTATVYTWYLSSTTHLEVPYSFYFYIYVAC